MLEAVFMIDMKAFFSPQIEDSEVSSGDQSASVGFKPGAGVVAETPAQKQTLSGQVIAGRRQTVSAAVDILREHRRRQLREALAEFPSAETERPFH
jgi:hypothetical protein